MSVPHRTDGATEGMRVLGRRVIGAYTIAEIEYAAGALLNRHAHALGGFALVTRGDYTESYGPITLNCAPSAVTFSPAAEAHTNRFAILTRCVTIEADEAVWQKLASRAPILRQPVVGRGLAPVDAPMHLTRELRSVDAASELIVEGVVTQLAALLTRTLAAPPRRRESWVLRLRERLDESLSAPPPLAAMAEGLGLHPAYMATAFQQQVGCTIGEYSRRRRVEWAANRLRESDDAIGTIALAAGFADQSHFTRVFRAHAGRSPAAFRFRRT